MRYASEQFKEKLNELIRPATTSKFEVNTSVANSAKAPNDQGGNLSFDYDVAPVKSPDYCFNDYYYAVLGDERGVDDPNRICAPVKVAGEFPAPDKSIPFGVTPYAAANTDVFIGTTLNYSYNFQVSNKPITVSFKGGVIPEYITIEYHDDINDEWVEADTIYNAQLDEEISYTPDPDLWFVFIRFTVKNTTKSGRYQLNWIRKDVGNYISFRNDAITSVNISEETDLASQSFPVYEMTVICLDVYNSYNPDSSIWKEYFKEGAPCFFRTGFDIGGTPEFIPLMYGKLTQAPHYEDGKITFKVAVDWNVSPNPVMSMSKPNLTNSPGDVVEGKLLKSFSTSSHKLFDVMDIFIDADDKNDSEYNFYGITEDARKMYANALGGYITANMNMFILKNTNMIQYRSFDDFITRYEQIKNKLESKPKVGKISVTRNENVTSADYVDIHVPTTTFAPHAATVIDVILQFFAIGKLEFTTTLPMGIEFVTLSEHANNDGTFTATVVFSSDSDEPIDFAPDIRFYKVDNTKLTETETLDYESTEIYTNDNELITNSYIADKVKRVAHFISDVSSQYEVDVMQDFRYELGDIVRLETQKGVFRTCIITGLKFTLPGSKGHVTCRKIFALEDIPKIIENAENYVFEETQFEREYIVSTGGGNLTIRATPHTTATAIGSVENHARIYSDEVVQGDDVGGVDAWVGYEGGYVSGKYLTPTPVAPADPPQKLTVLSTDNGSIVAGLVYDELVTYEDVLIVLGGTSFEYQVGAGAPTTETYNLTVTDKNKHVWYFYFMPRTPGYTLNGESHYIRLPNFTSGDPIGDCSAYGAINLIKAIYEEQGMTPPVDYTCEYHIIT